MLFLRLIKRQKPHQNPTINGDNKPLESALNQNQTKRDRQKNRQKTPNISVSHRVCMARADSICPYHFCTSKQVGPVVSALGDSENLGKFAPSWFLPINPSFIIKNAPNLKHRKKRHKLGKKSLKIWRFFYEKSPNMDL